jgi:hypothetical protein
MEWVAAAPVAACSTYRCIGGERKRASKQEREREKEKDADVLGKHESSVDTRVRTRTRKSIMEERFGRSSAPGRSPLLGIPRIPNLQPTLGVPCARFWLIH